MPKRHRRYQWIKRSFSNELNEESILLTIGVWTDKNAVEWSNVFRNLHFLSNTVYHFSAKFGKTTINFAQRLSLFLLYGHFMCAFCTNIAINCVGVDPSHIANAFALDCKTTFCCNNLLAFIISTAYPFISPVFGSLCKQN